jgi:xanthine dehydrogenase iron-sulfur cluster and FAD-binding subunit A
MKLPIQLTINISVHKIEVEPRKTLLAVLREQLHLTGTKEGCSTGDCGACTVLLDGEPITSCLLLAVQANGRKITTIEGIAQQTTGLHPFQDEMVQLGGAPMWILHCRDHHVRGCASKSQREPRRRRNAPRPCWQPVSLHGLHESD